ncbi:hypothetical protein Pla123a_19480 [Posidoniimonas polymericola]|uniref:Uncharacterized protein n=1 Tax=Posidoniimonas polymericola TaxID=2528002 RepID=A0A5C5YQT7_9BACT|nr:hypothetical protein [Posidoniimonas polymericola]TWT77291.1 hypothetical protein Pla123a_19480 [Posidoniimonas polymericola]
MSRNSESQSAAAWIGCLVLGTLLLAAGFIIPRLGGAPTDDAKSKAAEFLEASHAMEQAASAKSKEERTRRMAEVRDQYRQAREQAVEARSSGGSGAFWMKVCGGVLAAVGCFGVFSRGAS